MPYVQAVDWYRTLLVVKLQANRLAKAEAEVQQLRDALLGKLKPELEAIPGGVVMVHFDPPGQRLVAHQPTRIILDGGA